MSADKSDVTVVGSLDEIEKVVLDYDCEDVWCIGGGSIYEQMLNQKEMKKKILFTFIPSPRAYDVTHKSPR